MIKLRLIILASIFLSSVNHSTNGQSIGFRLGFNASYFGGNKYNGEIYNHDVQNLKPIYGLSPGINFRFPNKLIFSLLYFETGVDFIQKGTVEKYIYSQYSSSSAASNAMIKVNRIKINYFSLPLKINSIIKIKKSKLIITSGLYLANGISGHIDSKNFWVDSGNLAYASKYKINWTQNDDGYDYKRMDYGFTFGSGIQKGPFQLIIQVERGLKQINVFENHNISFNLSSSYYFNLKK